MRLPFTANRYGKRCTVHGKRNLIFKEVNVSIHPSLSSSFKNRKQRSVLKRFERIKYYISKGSFNEESPVFGLPKIKSLKIKVKKEKAAEKAPLTAGAPAAPSAGAGKQVKAAAASAPAAKTAKASPKAHPAK